MKVKEQPFYRCSSFHSHSKIFNNAQNSNPKMSVKRPLACSWAVVFTSVDKHLGISVILMLLGVYK